MAELVQVNISMTEEDSKVIDQMMVEDAYDNRSAFIRRLVRLEWQKRMRASEMQVEQMLVRKPDQY